MKTIILFLLFLLAVPALLAATYTARTSGHWEQRTTWGGSGPPVDGDTVSISDGVTVTVRDAEIVGSSGPSGTLAINCNNSGALVIALGGTLQVRGDVRYSAGTGTNQTPYLTVQAGGVLEFDSGQALSPMSTNYRAYNDVSGGLRGFVTAGNASNHAIVRSNAGGGNGYFGLTGAGGVYNLSYTDFLSLGSATTPAFSLFNWSGGSPYVTWNAVNNTFTSCGAIFTNGTLAAQDVFRHSFNVHTGSSGAFVMNRYEDAGSVQTLTTGVREIVANVFDLSLGNASYPVGLRDFTVYSNYFAGGMFVSGYNNGTWRYFQNNFYIGLGLSVDGDIRDSIFFVDDPSTNNPHVLNLTASGPETVSGCILDHTGDINTDSGEFVLVNLPLASGVTYAIKNNILLPNAGGHASTEIASVMQCCNNTGVTFDIDHNTYLGERTPGLNQDAVHTEEQGTNPSGQLDSFRSNLLWDITPGSSYKLKAQGSGGLDPCAPSRCDYNNGWNTKTDGGNFTNAGNGYADNFSATPGQHDFSVDPAFVDSTRNTATFDSAYLGNAAAPWTSGATYNVGDMVSSSDPTVYRGAMINYRYTNGTSRSVNCAGSNPQPGLLTYASRACWEWASLYRIRQAVATQTLSDDPVIGAHGVDIITVLIQWIRAGLSPTNSALALAGHDGQDIGAVPVTFAWATFPAVISGTPVRGRVRGAVR